ncbi:MAG: rRNA maturation RNase YbeY [Candidatus Vogelbacteria bacterium]|nr:rRNA maturation RNase YbeY [Candidatus Vogelbacteria bacterium]
MSLAFIDSKTSQALNLHFRDKDKPANVLSFPLGPLDGEILIDKELVPNSEKQLALFIHGLFHLKGYVHGSRMESEEKKLYGQEHRRRIRHRDRRRQARGG